MSLGRVKKQSVDYTGVRSRGHRNARHENGKLRLYAIDHYVNKLGDRKYSHTKRSMEHQGVSIKVPPNTSEHT